jgi:plasmid stabilization system protein ParE
MKPRKVKVVWTSVAAGDLERIASYLASESPLRAAAVIDRIVERTESLASLPNHGPRDPRPRVVQHQPPRPEFGRCSCHFSLIALPKVPSDGVWDEPPCGGRRRVAAFLRDSGTTPGTTPPI